MFSKAYTIASEFTQPVIISARFLDGSVSCSCGAFVVLNENGWIATAAHLWKSFAAFQQHRQLVDAYRSAALAIDQNDALDARQKEKRVRRLRHDPKWITHHSFWWSRDRVRIVDVSVIDEVDLAVGRLEPWERAWISAYPTIKDPAKPMEPGTALCKLGYFHEINATYDEATDGFLLAQGTLPIPRFPLEGIYTRNAVCGKTSDGKFDVEFLETSSPGLRGQSGGPIFDVNSTVWAIQSHTIHLPLGFTPKVRQPQGRTTEEHQFLNIGLGVHASVIVAVLGDLGIPFRLSDY